MFIQSKASPLLMQYKTDRINIPNYTEAALLFPSRSTTTRGGTLKNFILHYHAPRDLEKFLSLKVQFVIEV